MSEDSRNDTVRKIMAMDVKLTEQFNKVKDDPRKAVEVLSTKLKLYSDTRKLPNITDTDRLFFGYMEGDTFGQIALLWTQIQFNEQVSEIISRLDNLENDVKALKEKLNIN